MWSEAKERVGVFLLWKRIPFAWKVTRLIGKLYVKNLEETRDPV